MKSPSVQKIFVVVAFLILIIILAQGLRHTSYDVSIGTADDQLFTEGFYEPEQSPEHGLMLRAIFAYLVLRHQQPHSFVFVPVRSNQLKTDQFLQHYTSIRNRYTSKCHLNGVSIMYLLVVILLDGKHGYLTSPARYKSQ